MKKKIINIQYDTDGEKVDLPTELEIVIPSHIEDEEDFLEFISDEISNVTGFCHTGFEIEQKYIYRELKTRDGEREYYHKAVHEIDSDIDPKEYVDDIAKNFWEEDRELEDGGYYHLGMEVHVQVYKVEEITKEEFEILRKFL